ncbi:NAD(P)H-hydrate dehydratase, partial [Streptomyces chitinivorans]
MHHQAAGRRPALPPGPADATAAALLAAPAAGLALAAVTAQDPVAGLTGYVRLLQVFVLVPAALVLTLRSPRHARTVAASLVAVAVMQGAVGVHQYLAGTGASYRGENVRAVGTFGPADVMGMASAVSCGVVVALAAGLAPPAGAPRWLRPAALGTAAALLVPLILSFSRGAWISTAAACTAVLLLTGLRTALRALAAASAAAVVLVGGFGVGGDLVAERAASITEVAAEPDQSVTDRYTMWAAAVEIWHENPLTGVGPKGFAEHRDSHASLALSSASDTAGAPRERTAPVLLTPHAGEAAALLGVGRGEVESARLASARELARRYGAAVLLKGSTTVVAPPGGDGPLRVNPTGTGWLATAGSGDVLSGLAGSLLACGLAPVDAAVAGAYVHGLAGRRAAPLTSALDVAEALRPAWRDVVEAA